MGNKRASLDYDDVKARVNSASNDVIGELYGFGQALVSDAVNRLSKADGKAAGLVAFCGGVITLTVSTSPSWSSLSSPTFTYSVAIGMLAVFAGALIAASSVYPQTTEWYAENDWLRPECLKNPESMMRYRLLTMWRVVSSHHALYRRKTKRVKEAAFVVGLGFLALFVAFLNVLWRYSAF